MELEKLSFNQLKELLPQFDKNDMFSTLIRREMKNKYIQHKTQKKNQQNNISSSNNDISINASNISNATSNISNTVNAFDASNEKNSFSFYKNTSNMSKPPIYPTKKSSSADLLDIESSDHFNIQKNRDSFHNNYLHADNNDGISNQNPRVPKESSISGETIDRDKLNMGLFSRFTNEIEINNFKKTQKNTIRLE